MNELVCPKCQNEEGSTRFIRFDVDGDNHPLELRKCEEEDCGCQYEVRYTIKEVSTRSS